MTLTAFGPAYSKWSFVDLKRSIHDRGITTKVRDRKQMIRELRKADRAAIFRFFDLPAEMRNQVYQYVLEVDGSARIDTSTRRIEKWTSILATCKLAYDEASGLLYGNYHFPLRVSAGPGWTQFQLRVGADLNGHCIYRSGALYGWHEPKLEIEWPSIFERIQCLDIKVEIGKQQWSPHLCLEKQGAVLVNNILHQLQQKLAGRKDLRSIRVELCEYTGLLDTLLQSVLSPLPAIASRFEDCKFEFVNISEGLQLGMHEATSGFRKLRAINHDVEQAAQRELCSTNGKEMCDAIAQQTSESVADRYKIAEATNSIRVYAHDRLSKGRLAGMRKVKLIEGAGGVSDDFRRAVCQALKQLQA